MACLDSKEFMLTKPIFFLTIILSIAFASFEPDSAELFGEKFPKLDGMSTGEWWKKAKLEWIFCNKERKST